MRTKRMTLLWAAMALTPFGVSCADTATCDPGEMLYAGHCMAIPMQEPPDGGAGDETSIATVADAGAPDAQSATEGAPSSAEGDAIDEQGEAGDER
jgi:hypothetical protein